MARKVLLVGGLGGGGEEVFLRDLAQHPPPGIEYTLLIQPHQSAVGARCRVLTEIAFNRVIHPFLWPLPGLKAYDVDDRWDLIHVHNFPHHIRRPPGMPVVMSLGGGYRHYLEAYLGLPEDRVDALYARARRIYDALGITNELVRWKDLAAITVWSRFVRQQLTRRGVPEALVHEVPPGFPDPGELRPRGRGEGPFRFLLVGREPRRKGADLAREALCVLRNRGVDARLTLVGDPSYTSVDQEGVEGMGPVPRDTLMDEIFPQADAFLLPARAEGYGLVLVEAMSFGLPVVATRQGAFCEIVKEGETGLIVPGEDVEALASAMSSLALDPAGAVAMGDAGRRRFHREFAREVFHRRLVHVYDVVRSRN